jgi:hypothetical protein
MFACTLVFQGADWRACAKCMSVCKSVCGILRLRICGLAYLCVRLRFCSKSSSALWCNCVCTRLCAVRTRTRTRSSSSRASASDTCKDIARTDLPYHALAPPRITHHPLDGAMLRPSFHSSLLLPHPPSSQHPFAIRGWSLPSAPARGAPRAKRKLARQQRALNPSLASPPSTHSTS